MTVYTLTDGMNLPATMAGATAGDTIFLGTGTYTGAVTLKAEVTLAASHGATPVVTGLFTSAASGTYTLLRGITFDTSGVHTMQGGKAIFDGCTFLNGSAQFQGDSTGVFAFYGCKFYYNNYFSLLGSAHTFAGCLFEGATFMDSAPDSTVINCTLDNRSALSAPQILWQVDTLTARNLVITCPTQATDAPFDVFTSGSINNVVYDCDQAALDGQGNATLSNNKLVADVGLRSSWRLEADSPARGAGDGNAYADYPYGANRQGGVAADAGCYAYHGDTSAVFAPWPLTDPAYGLNLTDVSRGAMLVTLAPGLYHDPFDMGSYIAQEVSRFFGRVDFTWGVTATGAIVLHNPFYDTTGNVTTNNHASRIFGVINQTGVSDVTLAQNPRTLFTDLAWEAPTAPFIPAMVERYTFGQPDASALPANSERRFCMFRLFTRTDDTTRVRDVLNRWFSGSFLRVYRRWDETEPWSTSNDEGYDDIVALSVDGGDYPWYTTNLTSYVIEISGIAKDRSL